MPLEAPVTTAVPFEESLMVASSHQLGWRPGSSGVEGPGFGHIWRMYLHVIRLRARARAGSLASMSRRAAEATTGRDRGQLSPGVCSTLRMVSRTVTQLYDDVLPASGLRVTQFSILATLARRGEANLKELEALLAIDQTTLTRSLGLLERDGVIERASHPDGRIKVMRLTAKGRRALEVARPLWMRAQDRVLRELGTKAWARAQRRLAHLLHVVVEKRRLRRSPTKRRKAL
jgi:DNA-binding MarR family transcriptional regulator